MSILCRAALCMVSAACLLAPRNATADTFAFSETVLEDSGFNFFSNNGTTSSALTVGNDSASSFIDVAGSRMGASITAPDRVAQVYTNTEHDDVWFCAAGTGCDALPDPDRFHMGLTVHFDATVNMGPTSEMSFQASYRLSGGQLFSVGFFQDPAFEGGAQFADGANVVNIPLVTTVDAQGIHVSVDFSTVFDVRCQFGCIVNDPKVSPFGDIQKISAELEGVGTVDASHTFQVSLTPLDPGVTLVSADGRVASSAPPAVPEPGTALLLVTGLAAAARRRFSLSRGQAAE